MGTHATNAAERTILWRRLDTPGHEAARLVERGAERVLEGTAVFADEGRVCRLDYRVACDAAWRTTATTVRGWVGREPVEIEITADAAGRWTMNGREVPEVEGAVDVDLNFSPSTNLLPIRRLGLAVGGEEPVRAAWLRFPSLRLEPFEQRYRRLGEDLYRYESSGGQFMREIRVDPSGLVTLYPGLWETEALS